MSGSTEKKINILAIDDEQNICEEVCRLLARENFKIEYRQSGEKGLEYLEKNPETDIVILDINLGAGMNGIECLKEIKKKFKHMQVIMLTGEKDLNTGIAAMRGGAYDYMTKPFEKALFIEKAKGAIEKKKLSQLAEKEKLSLITGMAHGVSHQINNRLTEFSLESSQLIYEITSLLEMNKEYIDKNPEIKTTIDSALKTAEEISNNVRKTGGIIQGIIQYANAKTNGDTFGSFKLDDIIENAVKLLKVNNGEEALPLTIQPYDVNEVIFGNKALLLDSIYGILQNAYEAVQYRVKYKIPTEEYKPEITLSYTCSPDSYVIKIKDNGIGINEKDKQQVFAPYFTTKSTAEPGIGTGLYVIQRIIEDEHRGKLLFESQSKQGTTFFIELPRARKSISILIIDDEFEVVKCMVRGIERKGMKAVCADTGAEGLRLFQEHNPTCTFLDFHMPVMDGITVFEKIKKLDPDARVVFMTGSAEIAETQLKDIGADGCMLKPIMQEDLYKKIEELTRSQ